MNLPTASVVVCTRNRSRLLADACEAVLAMDYPPDYWELLIVDNRSDDDTPDVARSVAERHPGRVRVVQEDRLGLSAARNRGIQETHQEVVAFIDDDAFPEPEWLRSLTEALGQNNVWAAGGPVDPLFEGELPAWCDLRYLPYLTVWDLGPEPVELKYNEYPRGANMAFRRQTFERFGHFSHHLGRTGSSLLSCEETELCLRVERSGGKIVYVPGARVGHRVNAGRITEDWLVERFGAQGRSEAIVDWMHGGITGLKRGAQRFRKYARAARLDSADGSALYRRCQDRSFKAYLWSALKCPLSVPSYRPSPQADPVAPWLPFA